MEETQLADIVNTVNDTHEQIIKLNVTVNALIARLETFEKLYSSNIVAPKRSIKTAPIDDMDSVSSIDSKRKITDTSGSTSATGEHIVNALTFFKKIIIFKNYDNLREKYSNPELINTVKVGIKKTENTEAYWISVGNSIWKTLNKDQKKDVKDDFNRWKKINQSNADILQLNEDETDSS